MNAILLKIVFNDLKCYYLVVLIWEEYFSFS